MKTKPADSSTMSLMITRLSQQCLWNFKFMTHNPCRFALNLDVCGPNLAREFCCECRGRYTNSFTVNPLSLKDRGLRPHLMVCGCRICQVCWSVADHGRACTPHTISFLNALALVSFYCRRTSSQIPPFRHLLHAYQCHSFSVPAFGRITARFVCCTGSVRTLHHLPAA